MKKCSFLEGIAFDHFTMTFYSNSITKMTAHRLKTALNTWSDVKLVKTEITSPERQSWIGE